MRMVMVRVWCFLTIVVLAGPAWALNYSGSTWFDLSTLRFSGVPVSVPVDSEHIHGYGIVLDSALPRNDPGDYRSFSTGYAITAGDEILRETVPVVGTASSIASGPLLTATNTLVGPGSLRSVIFRAGEIMALEAGTLTMSVGYGLSHAGDVGSVKSDVIFESRFGSAFERTVLPAGNGNGTLSISRFFETGERAFFSAYTEIATSSTSVPLPGMLWPTAVGLLGLAGWWERRLAVSSS